MVLFLFVIMMLDLGHPKEGLWPAWREWLPALLLSLLSIICLVIVLVAHPQPVVASVPALSIREIGRYLFQEHGVAVELISLQLLFALVGALYLGKRQENEEKE